MHPTRNELPKELRTRMIALLNVSLADGLHLVLQSKQAHWNVKGPSFFSLHELFDKIYDQAAEWADTLAERAVALGGIAEGTLDSVNENTRLPRYRLDLSEGRAHVEALSDSLAAFGKSIREAIDTATEAGDADTADLFTEISRESDKMLWFLEAHLQAER